MSDSERCRAAAARYARLAEMSANADVSRSYRELERLWLEMALWTDRLDLSGHDVIRQRIYTLVDDSGQRVRALAGTLH